MQLLNVQFYNEKKREHQALFKISIAHSVVASCGCLNRHWTALRHPNCMDIAHRPISSGWSMCDIGFATLGHESQGHAPKRRFGTDDSGANER